MNGCGPIAGNHWLNYVTPSLLGLRRYPIGPLIARTPNWLGANYSHHITWENPKQKTHYRVLLLLLICILALLTYIITVLASSYTTYRTTVISQINSKLFRSRSNWSIYSISTEYHSRVVFRPLTFGEKYRVCPKYTLLTILRITLRGWTFSFIETIINKVFIIE